MAKVNLKTVILYDRRRMQPQTMEAILRAKDGDMIPVDPSELDAFTQLTFYEPDLAKEFKERTKLHPQEE